MKVLMIQAGGNFMLRGTTHPVCRDLMFSSTWLKNNGHQVVVYDRCIEKKSLPKVLAAFRAECAVVFVAHTSSMRDAIQVSEALKHEAIPVIWADFIPVICEELIRDLHCFDYALFGEFCISLQNLLSAMERQEDVGTVAGIGYFKNGVFTKTEEQPLQDLAQLPPTDWSLIDVEKCFRVFPGCRRMLYLSASVGCAWQCDFCYATFCYRKVRRKRPIACVLKEIEYLVRNHRLDGVNFSDELLSFTDSELEELKRCRNGLNNAFVWGGETRANGLTKQKLQSMYDAGCRWLLFGLESGSARIRKSIHKEYDGAHVRDVVDWCSEIGIATYGSFIIGFLGEDEQDLLQTVNFAKSLDLDAWLFNYYIPVTSTPAYERIKESCGFEIKSLMEYEELSSPDTYEHNFSAVSKKELATIKAYFDLHTVTNRKKHAKQPVFSQMFVKMWDSVKQYLKTDPKDFLPALFSIVKRGMSVMSFFLHPCIVGKYRLLHKQELTK